MDTAVETIRSYFGKLGLEVELADIYLALHSYGPQSISELSRNSKVERTRIYRLIDRLMESGLIELEAHSKRGVIKAAPIANIRILIHQREEELRNLHDELGLIEQALARNSLSNPDSRVQMYRGPEGVRRMFRNELRATGEILAYADRLHEEAAGKAFMEQWADDFEARPLQRRLLTNDSYARSLQAGKRANIAIKRQIKGDSRAVLADETFHMHNICSMYDNVVAYCNWKNGEVFGIEIHNESISSGQRQLFELLWKQAEPSV